MSNQASDVLQDAFNLIEENKLAEARALLEPLLESDSSDPTVWWVYAHAVEDSETGTAAIDKVLELDPTYPGARELKDQSTRPTTSDIDDFDDLSFDDDIDVPDKQEKSGSIITRLAIVGVIILVIGIIALLLLSSGSGNPPPTTVADEPTTAPTIDAQIITNPTSVSGTEIEPTVTDALNESTPTNEPTDVQPTEDTDLTEPTLTDEPVDTNVPVATETDEPVSTATITSEPANTDLIDPLTSLGVSDEDVITRTTIIGETLVITVCAPLRAESSIALNTVMNTFVEQEASLDDSVEAVATTLIDCDSEDAVPRTIGVERTVLRSLAQSEIEPKDFQRAWQPLP